MYCKYYQATVVKKKAWFLAGALRSFDHLAFDRTLDKQASIFEFFVPLYLESYFLELMNYLKHEGIIFDLEELPNRLAKVSECA